MVIFWVKLLIILSIFCNEISILKVNFEVFYKHRILLGFLSTEKSTLKISNLIKIKIKNQNFNTSK